MPPRFAPTLTDGVVTLRAHRFEDATRVLEQCVDPLSQRWTTVPIPYTLDDADGFVAQAMPAGWDRDLEWGFAIEVDGEYGGTVSLRPMAQDRAELAYGAHPAIRGTGAVGRALRLLVDWGFEEKGLQSLLWMANVGNWASRRAAWRLGFTIDGTMHRWLPHRGEYVDGWVGTLHRDDPRSPATAWLDVPRLEGDGFVLRAIRDDDAERIREGSADTESQRWLGQLPAPYSLEDARAYVEARRELAATGEGVTWAIADPDDDRLLGTVLWFHHTPRVSCEVGYWVHPEARGRGLATAAVALVTGHCFESLGVQRVTALVAADNHGSRRVLERAGLRQYAEARFAAWVREGWVDAALYDVTAAEWAAERRLESSVAPMTAKPSTDSTTPSSSGER